MSLLADISTGNTGFADVMFLVALIVALLAAVIAVPRMADEAKPWTTTLGLLALAALALGWLVL